MDISKPILMLCVVLVYAQSFAQNVTTQDPNRAPTDGVSDLGKQYTGDPDWSEKISSKEPPEVTDVVTSNIISNKYFKINYSGHVLDEHALRVAADCLPLESSGQIGMVVVPVDDSLFMIPTKPSSLPPFPEGGGKEGIHGVDVNQNCVRDDIEHYIFKAYSKADQEQLRLYLYEYAIWLNFYLIDGISDKTVEAVTRQKIKAGLCLNTILDQAEAKTISDAIFGESYNTEARTYRYFDNTKVLSGWVIEETINPSC